MFLKTPDYFVLSDPAVVELNRFFEALYLKLRLEKIVL
jgi:hypothetical protein